MGLDGAAAAHGGDDIDAVADDQADRSDQPQLPWRSDPDSERRGEAEKEEKEIAPQRLAMQAQRTALVTSFRVHESRHADQRHRHRGEQKWGTDDRPDGDLVGLGIVP